MAIGTSGLRDPLRDIQQEAPFCCCEKCHGSVYKGEPLYRWEEKRVCPDCFEGAVTLWLHTDPIGLACAIGVTVEETE